MHQQLYESFYKVAGYQCLDNKKDNDKQTFFGMKNF